MVIKATRIKSLTRDSHKSLEAPISLGISRGPSCRETPRFKSLAGKSRAAKLCTARLILVGEVCTKCGLAPSNPWCQPLPLNPNKP